MREAFIESVITLFMELGDKLADKKKNTFINVIAAFSGVVKGTILIASFQS